MRRFLALALVAIIAIFGVVMFAHADAPEMANIELAQEKAELTLQFVPMPAVNAPMLQYTGENSEIISSIVSHFYAMEEEFQIQGEVEAIKDAALLSFKMNPEIFWVESIKVRIPEESTVQFLVEYNMSDEERKAASAQIETIANALVEASDGTVEGTMRTLHMWMDESVAYDYNAETQKSDARAHVDSTFVEGMAVCSGYAQTVCYVAYHAGYEAAYCVGYVGDTCHAWTVIKDDGNEVLVDMLNQYGYVVGEEMQKLYQAEYVCWYK